MTSIGAEEEGRMGKLVGERIKVGQLEVIFYGHRDHTSGHADVYEVIVPEGRKVPGAHAHVDVDEVILGLEGVVTYRVGAETFEVGAGQSAVSPKGVVHHFENRHPGTARFLVTATPARMGPEYFREVAAVLAQGGPPDMAKVKVVMNKYGLEPMPLPA
jgi:quercetin dioxygenase-like cupin family protein